MLSEPSYTLLSRYGVILQRLGSTGLLFLPNTYTYLPYVVPKFTTRNPKYYTENVSRLQNLCLYNVIMLTFGLKSHHWKFTFGCSIRLNWPSYYFSCYLPHLEFSRWFSSVNVWTSDHQTKASIASSLPPIKALLFFLSPLNPTLRPSTTPVSYTHLLMKLERCRATKTINAVEIDLRRNVRIFLLQIN